MPPRKRKGEDEARVGDALPPNEDDDALLPTDAANRAQGPISDFVARRQAQIGLSGPAAPPPPVETDGPSNAPDEPEPPEDELPDALERAGRFADPREDARETLRRRLNARLQTIDPTGGEWRGIRVITRRDLLEVMAEDLPAASNQAATFQTPATLTVEAVCPRCHNTQTMVAKVATELREDDTGADLTLKFKAKKSAHQCGQLRLAPTAPGPDETGTPPMLFDGGQEVAPDADAADPDDADDVRPTGDVNPGLLRGEAERSSEA